MASAAAPPSAPLYAASPQRWGVLAVYAAASFMGALVWNILVRALLAACSATRLPPSLLFAFLHKAACACAAPLTRRALRAQAPVYAIAEARFDRGPQAINSLANVRARQHAFVHFAPPF
jgi:hypothetical protein